MWPTHPSCDRGWIARQSENHVPAGLVRRKGSPVQVPKVENGSSNSMTKYTL